MAVNRTRSAVVALALSASSMEAQDAGALRASIATVLAGQAGAHTPGALVAVTHRGQTSVLHSAGLANLDHRVPLSADSRFYLGSLSKQFTAASIALLSADGKLSLHDPVGKHVAGLPARVAAIPVAHLLHHRSGMRDYLKIRDLNGEKDEPFDNDEAVEIIKRQRSLVFAPGAQYQYSNSNYILLAEVVRAVSGKSLADFARTRIFEPAGMTATGFETDATSVVPDRVVSYRLDDAGRWHRYVKLFDAIGDGGAYASARDLLRWDEILRSRSVLPAAVFDILLTPPSGSGTPYAGGLLIRSFLGQQAIEHSGFMFGFQHHYLRFPRQDLAILILTNSREIDSFALREHVARAAFEMLTGATLAVAKPAAPGPTATSPTPPRIFPPLDSAIAGMFYNAEIPLTVQLFVVDGRLHIHPASFRRVAMNRTAAGDFTALGGEIEVRLGATPDTWMLRVRQLGEFVFSRRHDNQM